MRDNATSHGPDDRVTGDGEDTPAQESFGLVAAVGGMPDRLVTALRSTWTALAGPGSWWTAAERVALAGVCRDAFAQRHVAPWLRTTAGDPDDGRVVDEATKAIMVRLGADARTIDEAWAAEAIAHVGDAAYVELVALAATMAVVDAFAEALGLDREPLPAPSPGEPSRVRPDGMGDIGAYVPMVDPFPFANVGRALTLCPDGSRLYRTVGNAFYHDDQFVDLAWDRVISRPQTEILATAVSAANECFY